MPVAALGLYDRGCKCWFKKNVNLIIEASHLIFRRYKMSTLNIEIYEFIWEAVPSLLPPRAATESYISCHFTICPTTVWSHPYIYAMLCLSQDKPWCYCVVHFNMFMHLNLQMSQNYLVQLITNGDKSVDTFFTLSGMLVAFNFFKLVNHRRKFPFIYFYIHRIIRFVWNCCVFHDH